MSTALGSIPPILEVFEDLAAGVGARCARDPSARMGARAAEVEARDGRPVLGVAEDRPHGEELVECCLAVEEVAAGHAELRLDVDGREDLPRQNETLEARSIVGKNPLDVVAEFLA